MHYKEAKSIPSSQNGMNIYRGCRASAVSTARQSNATTWIMIEDIEVKVNALNCWKQRSEGTQKCMISTGSMCDP